MSDKCYHEEFDCKCQLTKEKCNSCPNECIYYKIYEEAYSEGYSDGQLGEDL